MVTSDILDNIDAAIQVLSLVVIVDTGIDNKEYGSTSSKEQTSSVMSSPLSKD
ncbi:MAG: hypothetical protein HZC29_05085 [Thaumarchaeota archaeon]|nr:hypothetical protein [Nitrososphaerota archaeon]